ncbi:hypothetical protein ACHAW6_008342 [Cyclotella cf. meneghiniana]
MAQKAQALSGHPSEKIFKKEFVPHRTASELANALINVCKLYSCASFVCQTALMDGEFEKVKNKLLDKITINVCSKNEHVPKIEQKI